MKIDAPALSNSGITKTNKIPPPFSLYNNGVPLSPNLNSYTKTETLIKPDKAPQITTIYMKIETSKANQNCWAVSQAEFLIY